MEFQIMYSSTDRHVHISTLSVCQGFSHVELVVNSNFKECLSVIYTKR
jgi:hypothetical protein